MQKPTKMPIIIWGTVFDEKAQNKVRVSGIATGFGAPAENATTASMTSVAGSRPTAQAVNGAEAASSSLILRDGREQSASSGSDVIKLKKLSLFSSAEDEEKYEIPTFLHKQVD